MQKVVLALIEGWVANGSPDPLTYGKESGETETNGIDIEARQGLLRLNNEILALKDRIVKIEEREIRRTSAKRGLDELAALMQESDDREGE